MALLPLPDSALWCFLDLESLQREGVILRLPWRNLPTHLPWLLFFRKAARAGQCGLGCLPLPDPSKSCHAPAPQPPASQGQKAERLLAELSREHLGFPQEESGVRRGAADGSLFSRLCYFMS